MMSLDSVFNNITFVSVFFYPIAYYIFNKTNWTEWKRQNVSFAAVAIVNMVWLLLTTIDSLHQKEPIPMASIDTKIGILIMSYLCFISFYYINNRWIRKMQSGARLIVEYFTITLFVFVIVISCFWWENEQLLAIYQIHPDVPNGYMFSPGRLYDLSTRTIPVLGLILFIAKNMGNYIQISRKSHKQKKELEDTQLHKALAEAQLNALSAKVKPHFLYNALNSIAGLAIEDGEKTRKMALALSRFFRYSCNREQQSTSSLEKEIEVISTYLEIEKIRFGERLSYSFSIDPETKKLHIPYFLLQPIVENCIKHGTSENKISLTIEIISQYINHHLVLYIRDNGIPFPANLIPKYGLSSIYDKLDVIYPNRYEVEIHNHPYKEVMICIQDPSKTNKK